MPVGSKNKKRATRRLPSTLLDESVVNLGGGSSIDDCLGEFEQATLTASSPLLFQGAIKEESPAKKLKSHHLDSIDKNSNDVDNDLLLSTQLLPLIGKACQALHRRDRVRLSNWKANFGSWQTTGRYIPGLLPSFDLELTRHFKVHGLSTFLLKASPQLRMPSFERWLIDVKVEEAESKKASSSSSHYVDPVLTIDAQGYAASQRLIQEIMESDPDVDAENVVQQLCQKTTLAAEELSVKARQFANQCPLHKGDRIVVEEKTNRDKKKNKTEELDDFDDDDKNTARILSLVFHRKRWKQPFRIKVNATHYHRLQSAFLQTHNLDPSSNKGKRATIHVFHLIVMTMALRYSSLSGGQLLNDLRGGGMQGAIHGQVFEVLQQELVSKRNNDHYLIEGFASPWNNACTNYASAFSTDLDFHFGSFGNFLEMRPSKSVHYVCEANPPFAPALMNRMVDHIETLLKSANQHDTSTTFVVVVPTGTTSSNVAPAKAFANESFERMVDSSYCVRHMVLSARDHGYVEGAQHLRPTRYKESQYDTSIILLMSDEAQKIYSEKFLLGRVEDRLRKAFASRHVQELALRRANDK